MKLKPHYRVLNLRTGLFKDHREYTFAEGRAFLKMLDEGNLVLCKVDPVLYSKTLIHRGRA